MREPNGLNTQSRIKNENLYYSSDAREFFVFVDPRSWLVKHHVETIGCFVSTPRFNTKGSPFLFLPNPDFNDVVSPFQHGMLMNYMADYNLEIHRNDRYRDYPSRLSALFLLRTLEEAKLYRQFHPDHVANRILKRCVTKSKYTFSVHDASWVDFLRIPHSLDDSTIYDVTSSYWEGKAAREGVALTMGQPWKPKSVMEVLFVGRVDFPDRSLNKCELTS